MVVIDKLRTAGAFAFCFVLAVVSFYAAGFGQADPAYFRSLMLLAAAGGVFLHQPLALTVKNNALRWALGVLDIAMFAVLCTAIFMFIGIAGDVSTGIVILTEKQVWFAFAAILILLDLTRRVFGLPVVILAAFALVFIIYGNHMPGFLKHRGFSIERTVENLWYSFTGIFGLPTAIILDYVLIFVVFGAVLQGTGAGDRLLKIVLALTGRTRGGPAHAAIWSSCLFGTISGSVTANVVGTGTFTIPLTISRGFPRAFAGAVEAVSSAGGQLMPPVMGAAAFLMAELTGTPYIKVALGALMPALFYYAGIFISVAIEARKRGIQPIPPEERPVLTLSDWLYSIQFIGPIIVIVGVLVSGKSAAAAGFYATITALVLSFMNPDFRKNPISVLTSLASGGRAGAALMVSAGALGVIIGAMEISGLGIKFANMVLSVSETNFIGALVMTMLACILLGMGMPTLPAYLVIVLVMGPAIAKFGVPIVAVHFFVMYFGVLSNVTPPVAIAAYAASPIARADPTRIGIKAVHLAIVGFIVPFVFVLEPSLLIIVDDFNLTNFIYLCVRLTFAILMLTTAFAKYDVTHISYVEGALRIALALVMIFGVHFHEWLSPAALLIGAALLVLHRVRARQAAGVDVPAPGMVD